VTAQGWVQLALTVFSFAIAMVVFYFKSDQALRDALNKSETRLREDVKTDISKLIDDIGALNTRIAIIEALDERGDKPARGRLPSAPGRY